MTARALLAVLALVPGLPAAAETLYVVDRLHLGLHQDKALDSPIVKVIPSGTPLEELERDGDLIRVETTDGAVGWIDATYATSEVPAALKLSEVEAQLAERDVEVEAVRAEIADLQVRLADAQERAATAEASLVEAEQTRAEMERTAPAETAAESPIPTDTLRDMQRLAEENQKLKQRVSEFEAQIAMREEQQPEDSAPAESPPSPAAIPAPEPAAPAAPLPPPPAGLEDFARWERWHWMLAGSALLLAFGLGMLLIDWNTRRRHGGFRV